MTPPRESKQQASWQRGFQDGPSNEDMLGTGEDANSEKMKRPGPRLFHTLAACTRCRSVSTPPVVLQFHPHTRRRTAEDPLRYGVAEMWSM